MLRSEVEMTSSVPFAEYTIIKMTIAKVRNYVYEGHCFCRICLVINYCAMELFPLQLNWIVIYPLGLQFTVLQVY